MRLYSKYQTGKITDFTLAQKFYIQEHCNTLHGLYQEDIPKYLLHKEINGTFFNCTFNNAKDVHRVTKPLGPRELNNILHNTTYQVWIEGWLRYVKENKILSLDIGLVFVYGSKTNYYGYNCPELLYRSIALEGKTSNY